jgi:hypothetical protein
MPPLFVHAWLPRANSLYRLCLGGPQLKRTSTQHCRAVLAKMACTPAWAAPLYATHHDSGVCVPRSGKDDHTIEPTDRVLVNYLRWRREVAAAASKLVD